MTDAGMRGHGDAAIPGHGDTGTRRQGDTGKRFNGFTLLEVMVAVAILAFVLVSLMGLQSSSTRDVLMAERITVATLLAKRVMTETLVVKPLVPQEKDGEFTEEEFKEYAWKKIVAPTPVPQVLEVRVAVLWKEGERLEQVELVSYE